MGSVARSIVPRDGPAAYMDSLCGNKAPHWTLTMPVSITNLSESEFERLTQSIASDMQSLSFHWTLYNKLQDA